MAKCRACGGEFIPETLLTMGDMPRAAQHLPGPADLATEYGVNLDLRQCECCGLIQLTQEPVPYFREVIRAAAYSPEMKCFREEQFARWVDARNLRGKKVLEIGCGKGEYLQLMNEAGAECHGLEYAAESVAECRRNGLRVEQVYLETGEETLPGAPFDGFFILNYLEHLPNIREVLAGIRRNLAPGAAGLVEVPNFDMCLSEGLLTEITADHLFYFTSETLRNLLSNSGFEVLSIQGVWHNYILSAQVRKRPAATLGKFAGEIDSLKRSLLDFTASRKTAVWGAGHQALAVLALAELAERIAYVVDSAPFKQGRFTPATHIPIVPPDRLDGDPPDAVIVMAAAYSDEVLEQIRKRHGDRFVLAVLRGNRLEIYR